MEKKEEEIDSNDSNEEEEFPLYKRKHKLDLTIEEIKNKYEIYLNCKLKYPKSQFCFFYFKGTCLLGDKCQFCHGYKEFSMDRFFTFLQDKNAVEKSSQKFYQKFYFNQIIPKEQYGFYTFGRIFSGRIEQGVKIRILGPNYIPGKHNDYLLKKLEEC